VIASLRLLPLMLGIGCYLCLGLLVGGLFFIGAYFYPFIFTPDIPAVFISGQVVRTLIIAFGAYIVSKKSAPVSLFNVIIYTATVATAVFIVSLFNPDAFILERLLSAFGAVAGAYLGYSFYKDGQSQNNFVGENR
jgi:hypothetical protein